MELSELAELLTLAAAYDHRPEPEEEDARAWHLIVGYYDADLARACLLEHYTQERRRLWPADIVDRADAKIAADPFWQREWWRRHPPVDPDQRPAVAPAGNGELPRGR
jgi:hypothetical protein